MSYSGHPCIIPPVSGPASSSSHVLLLLCVGLVTPDPSHQPSAQTPLTLRLGGVGQEGTGTHMLSGRSGDASAESLSPRGGLLDQTTDGRMKGDVRSCSTDWKLTTSWFPCCFPTALADVINNSPTSLLYSTYFALLHLPSLRSVPLFFAFFHHYLHLWCCVYTWDFCLLNQWFRASYNGKLIKTTTSCSGHCRRYIS